MESHHGVRECHLLFPGQGVVCEFGQREIVDLLACSRNHTAHPGTCTKHPPLVAMFEIRTCQIEQGSLSIVGKKWSRCCYVGAIYGCET